jgi:AcrR family transcriptional regulator
VTRPYHHGDLRRALLAAAAAAITESGPAAVSLRDLARRAGVSHAAPAHHFGDKAGLLAALATEGYDRLADALDAARIRTGSILEIGVAYVTFAVDNRAHFDVMFRPDLYPEGDPDLTAAQDRATAALAAAVATLPAETVKPEEAQTAGLSAWSIVHGFATLWLSDAFPPILGDDPQAAARAVIRRLFY